MELSTFGAICKFAMELEKAAAEFYARLARDASPDRRAQFEALAQAHSRRMKMAEQARRELVTEMILEPIHGLSDDMWELAPGATPGELEARIASFYCAAADKVSIPQAGRFFRKLVHESEKLVQEAQALA